MKKILVPTDFSENAEKALHFAKIIAAGTDAELEVIYAFQPFLADLSVPATETSEIFKDLENADRQQLETWVAALRQEGFRATGEMKIGGVHQAIIDRASETGADLIVIGRTGKGGFIDKLFGSNAVDIALKAPCPVLVIPPQAVPGTFKKLLYATQLEYEETAIIQQVKLLANQLGAALHFVKIDAAEQANIHADTGYINDIVEAGLATGEIAIRQAKTARQGIQDYADEIAADLVIVSARERGFLEKYLIDPGITKGVILNTVRPVLVYHLKQQ